MARINTRYTVLRSVDGTDSMVPNEMLVSGAVVNSSLSDKKVRIATTMIVGFDTNLDTVLPKLVAACAALPRVLDTPAPEAMLNRFAPNGLELEVGMWIADPETRGSVLSEANLKIWSLLQSEGISLPKNAGVSDKI